MLRQAEQQPQWPTVHQRPGLEHEAATPSQSQRETDLRLHLELNGLSDWDVQWLLFKQPSDRHFAIANLTN